MMSGGFIIIIFLFVNFIWLFEPSLSHPLCTNLRQPFTTKSPLVFCPYDGAVCCNNKQDYSIQKQFLALNISNTNCSSLVKSILCASCDKFSAELFRVESETRRVPVLCNSTTSNSIQTSQEKTSFCAKVWDTCENVSIANSPFAISLQGSAGKPLDSNLTKLTDIWQSKTDFCRTFGGSSSVGASCFDGRPVFLNETETPSPPSGMCLEKIGNGSYLNLVAHPDGSSRAFFSSQSGKIWLATIPEEGSGGLLELDQSSPFLDLTDEVHYDTEFGMMGIAFHPKFPKNGRFFVSFNCDKTSLPGCSGRCACNSDVDCDPSKLVSDNGARPCQYQSVIAEFTINGTSSQSLANTSVRPLEVRRILTMGLPFTSHHGGQILFGPSDGYLYFMMGDGGGEGDPYNFAQNKKSLLGKVMRLDIDNIPSSAEITQFGLWGNYSIPKDNPYTEDKTLQPEIWALGFRNPWRCSFDSSRPSYFMCADVGQDQYEEVNIVSKGGNYGWRVYEGPYHYNPPESPGGNTSVSSIRPILPVMGYNHSAVNKQEGSASITGGYFYRSKTDPCMHGRYLYADLYASAILVGTESPENSGNFTSNQITFKCANDSPIQCNSVPGGSLPALGYIFSFGEDNNKDMFVLASSGVYRIVSPSRCNYACSKEKATNNTPRAPSSPSPSLQASLSIELHKSLVILFSFWLLLMALI